MSDLKPCPFCGGRDIDPKGRMSNAPNHDGYTCGPRCMNCGASAESAEAWNTRPASVPVEALRVQIDEWRAQEAIDPNEIDYCADLNALIDHEIEYAERREGGDGNL